MKALPTLHSASVVAILSLRERPYRTEVAQEQLSVVHRY
jgi:hypothetical protein